MGVPVYFAGEPLSFEDMTCNGDPGCLRPTSHLWDFDTYSSSPSPSASGSSEANPVYTFDSPGSYLVELLVRNADRESRATMMIEVVDGLVSIPTIFSQTGTTAPANFEFQDQSTSDASDPIVSWNWDFAGFGVSVDRDPVFTFNSPGTYTISLTVETRDGRTDTGSLEVVLD